MPVGGPDCEARPKKQDKKKPRKTEDTAHKGMLPGCRFITSFLHFSCRGFGKRRNGYNLVDSLS